MAYHKEIAIFQKEHLYTLLATKAVLDVVPRELEQFISQQISKMDAEDVSYVREQVELLYPKK